MQGHSNGNTTNIPSRWGGPQTELWARWEVLTQCLLIPLCWCCLLARPTWGLLVPTAMSSFPLRSPFIMARTGISVLGMHSFWIHFYMLSLTSSKWSFVPAAVWIASFVEERASDTGRHTCCYGSWPALSFAPFQSHIISGVVWGSGELVLDLQNTKHAEGQSSGLSLFSLSLCEIFTESLLSFPLFTSFLPKT